MSDDEPLPLPPAEISDPVARARWYLDQVTEGSDVGLVEHLAFVFRAVDEVVTALERQERT